MSGPAGVHRPSRSCGARAVDRYFRGGQLLLAGAPPIGHSALLSIRSF
jgi:hypothetical protein